ncbi:hypothetical protein [Pengzhenrongella sicca]|uniref:ATP/GTP-binding protein n=1 Tax=Pengzhenrongella sicca TaxID=2819238 RepID=A0A8A4ZDV6_9MICO|nr:hypothetical protein [Pengzhenrongella sicca]QTE28736.1 hypothetical protein J4E96_15520 [Pengzhenrongella sicca]
MPSGRSSKRHPRGGVGGPPPLDLQRALGGRSSEDAADGAWTVQSVNGSERTFRCPGCQQLIAPGTPHLVAWASDGLLGAQASLEARRHWHRSCWAARGRRR